MKIETILPRQVMNLHLRRMGQLIGIVTVFGVLFAAKKEPDGYDELRFLLGRIRLAEPAVNSVIDLMKQRKLGQPSLPDDEDELKGIMEALEARIPWEAVLRSKPGRQILPVLEEILKLPRVK